MTERNANNLMISPPRWQSLNLKEDVTGPKRDQMDLIDAYYLPTICHTCKNITPTLKKCGGCRLFSYCSKEHQIVHWKVHKDFCKMMQKMLVTGRPTKRLYLFDLDGIQQIDHEGWVTLRYRMPTVWMEKLNRKVSVSETQIWMFPRVCEVCKYYDQDKLVDCKECYSVAYCSVEHQQNDKPNHDKYCQKLKDSYDINKYIFEHSEKPEIEVTISKDLVKLPKDMEGCIDECIKLNTNDTNSRMLASDTISPVATILFGLEQLGLLKDRKYPKNELTIHFIGAALYEISFNWRVICSFLFEYITNLKKLNILLIGPQTPEKEIRIKIKPTKADPRSIVLRTYKDQYDDFLLRNEYIDPDLVVAYNCGFHEFTNFICDFWHNSIVNIFLVKDIPLIVTSYTEKEAKLDLKVLAEFAKKKKVIIRAQMNPYCTLHPIRDWETEKKPIFYINNYLTVLTT